MGWRKHVGCWCGNANLSSFSEEYWLCEQCQTLVLRNWADDQFSVEQDDNDFYGKSYWFKHMEEDLGFGNILTRSRTDLPERALHWLRTLLTYKLPPAHTLELGCSHGGFVALLQSSGFVATGLEVSPWVVRYAHETFGVPVLLGKLEDQQLPAASLDVIALMDVLEHLPDPATTMACCLGLLKPDGILLVQTPRYREGTTYAQMLERHGPFLEVLKAPEHVHLFSESAVIQFFQRLGAEHIVFEPPVFSRYDMFLAVSRAPLHTNSPTQIEQHLLTSPGGRLMLALLDKDTQHQDAEQRWRLADFDRTARLDQVQQYDAWLKQAQAELKQTQAELKQTQAELKRIRQGWAYKMAKLFRI